MEFKKKNKRKVKVFTQQFLFYFSLRRKIFYLTYKVKGKMLYLLSPWFEFK
jgi:hypothetical protein